MSDKKKRPPSSSAPASKTATPDVAFVRALAEIVEAHGLSELRFKFGDGALVIRRGAVALPAEADQRRETEQPPEENRVPKEEQSNDRRYDSGHSPSSFIR